MNYNVKMSEVENLKEMEVILEEHKNKVLNNEECRLDEFTVKNAVDKINKDFEKAFTGSFLVKLAKDRQKAFAWLLANPSFDKVVYKVNENGTFEVESKTTLFKFANLEKAFQISKSKDTNKKGDPIPNKSVTVFGALRFYGLVSVFVRNLQKQNFEIDESQGFALENVVIDEKTVFEKGEGECFASNSNNALEKQLNVIVKVFGYDVKMLKKDLPILKLKAQKINQDKKNAQFSVNAVVDDKAVLKFADVIFGVVASRSKGKDVEIVTSKKVDKQTQQND